MCTWLLRTYQFILFQLCQHFPREIAKYCLRRNQRSIQIVDVDKHELFNCKINTARRKKKLNKYEKYIAVGWYEFLKTKGVSNGDTLMCQMA